ncbi:hypothetical protein ACGFJT_41815 [Actinomadura geliboluensis]|uniref:hypothetical protein n=1 Tax=Actinomadura geliboluensis TaxID=882440 RepID=UPI00371F3280
MSEILDEGEFAVLRMPRPGSDGGTAALGISEWTVRRPTKLGAWGVVQTAAVAVDLGLVTPGQPHPNR